MWSEIEAIALDRVKSEKLIDLTVPDKERLEKRAGKLLAEFSATFSHVDTKASAKRKATAAADTDSPRKAIKKENNNGDEAVDVEKEAVHGKVRFYIALCNLLNNEDKQRLSKFH